MDSNYLLNILAQICNNAYLLIDLNDKARLDKAVVSTLEDVNNKLDKLVKSLQ